MNKTQANIITAAQLKINKQTQKLEAVKNELQDTYGNMSETAQEGDKGSELSEQLEKLGEVINTLEEADGQLSDLV
jgi:hypothetical protein